MMDLSLRIPVIWVSILVVGLWFFLPFFKSSDEFDYCENTSYSIREFNEDMSKIYYDLGNFSLRRGDFQSALKSFSIALAHNPQHSTCIKNIELCKEKLKQNISNAVEFLAKLDSSK
jgi:tetratricopeptide (TPR) repeat protein